MKGSMLNIPHMPAPSIRGYFNEDLLYMEKQKVKQSESED